MKTSHNRLKSATTTYLAIATLILLLGTIFFTINRAMDAQRFKSSAAVVSPPYGGIFTCPGNPACPSDMPSQPAAGGISAGPSQTPGQENNPPISQTPQNPGTDPCLSGASLAHGDRHWKHDGGVSGFMEALLKFFMELINLLLKLFGGTPIEIPSEGLPLPSESLENPESPTDPTNPGQNPQTPNPQPCKEPNPAPSVAPSMGVEPSNAMPSTPVSVAPSGAAPSGTPGGGNGDPTVATCGGSANTPSSPITGYTIKKCEDFNGTSTPSGWSLYGEGSGGGTIVGRGRWPEQCTFGNGVVTLTQDADGATCGMSSDFGQKYGYWEARMRTYTTGNGSGSAPHPVMLLWPDTSWTDGELDWVETDIGDDGIGVFFHCTDGDPSKNCYHTTHKVDITQWHTYGFEWTATGMKGFVDGVQIYETDGAGGNPTVSMHQTLQLDNNTGQMPPNPGKMEVDWVHMYSK